MVTTQCLDQSETWINEHLTLLPSYPQSTWYDIVDISWLKVMIMIMMVHGEAIMLKEPVNHFRVRR